MAVDYKAGTFGQVLLWLASEEDGESKSYSLPQHELRNRVSITFPRLETLELQSFMKKQALAGDLFVGRKFLYLKMVEDHGWWLPIATLKFDLEHDDLAVRIGLFRLIEEKPGLFATGFRFETPTTPVSVGGAWSTHGFHHAQAIRDLVPGAKPLPASPWTPEEQPSFFLRADNYTQLLLVLLVTVYGGTRLTSLPGDLRKMLTSDLKAIGHPA